MKVIAVIERQAIVRQIPDHLSLRYRRTEPPRIARSGQGQRVDPPYEWSDEPLSDDRPVPGPLTVQRVAFGPRLTRPPFQPWALHVARFPLIRQSAGSRVPVNAGLHLASVPGLAISVLTSPLSFAAGGHAPVPGP